MKHEASAGRNNCRYCESFFPRRQQNPQEGEVGGLEEGGECLKEIEMVGSRFSTQ